MADRIQKRTFPRGPEPVARLYSAVAAAIDAADPLGLLACGAPDDEYSSEVSTIVPRLATAQDVAAVQDILHEEFVRWFSPESAGPRDAYAGLAAKVWRALQEYRSTTG